MAACSPLVINTWLEPHSPLSSGLIRFPAARISHRSVNLRTLQPLGFCEKSGLRQQTVRSLPEQSAVDFGNQNSLHFSQQPTVANTEIEASLLGEMQAKWTCRSVYVTFPHG